MYYLAKSAHLVYSSKQPRSFIADGDSKVSFLPRRWPNKASAFFSRMRQSLPTILRLSDPSYSFFLLNEKIIDILSQSFFWLNWMISVAYCSSQISEFADIEIRFLAYRYTGFLTYRIQGDPILRLPLPGQNEKCSMKTEVSIFKYYLFINYSELFGILALTNNLFFEEIKKSQFLPKNGPWTALKQARQKV